MEIEDVKVTAMNMYKYKERLSRKSSTSRYTTLSSVNSTKEIYFFKERETRQRELMELNTKLNTIHNDFEFGIRIRGALVKSDFTTTLIHFKIKLIS